MKKCCTLYLTSEWSAVWTVQKTIVEPQIPGPCQPFSNSLHLYGWEDVPLRKVLGSERKLYSGALGQRAMTWKCPLEEQHADVLLFQRVSSTGTVSCLYPVKCCPSHTHWFLVFSIKYKLYISEELIMLSCQCLTRFISFIHILLHVLLLLQSSKTWA